MEDFRLVDGEPLKVPHACLLCRGNLGQLLDTGRELIGYGRIYICETCAKAIAVPFGYARGKRMAQLSRASSEMTRLEAEVGALNERLAEETAKREEMAALAAAAGDELALARQRIEQLESRFIDQAREARELVAGAIEGGD